MYQLRIGMKFYNFDSAKEAYLYYLNNFATKEDFEYYKKISEKDLKDCADDEKLIGCMFDNVFNPSHHIYEVGKRKDGQIFYRSL